MNIKERLRGVAIAIALLIVCFPIAFIVTLLTSHFWSWFERTFGIEAYGHSGPAEWCYLVSYSLIVLFCAYIWFRTKKRNVQ